MRARLLLITMVAICVAPAMPICEEVSQGPLILLSTDGMRWDYPDLTETPAIDRLRRRGASAERLIPVYPTRTFPTHYSIVTGLYPTHHGIVSNTMRDPGWPEVFSLGNRKELIDPRWWGGEPIWVTAENAGISTAIYFWPGSETEINGVRPQRYTAFDATTELEAIVDAVLAWVTGEDPPGFIAMYFLEPNGAGHRYGPTAVETMAEVRRIDGMIGRLLEGLDDACIEADLVIVSDHGMAQNSSERVIVIDELAPLKREEILEAGAMVQIYPLEGREEMLFESLQDAHPHLEVYRKPDYPERLHLSDHPRLPPILAIPDNGWEVVTKSAVRNPDFRVVNGNHGHDPRHRDLHSVFIASGPSFRRGARLEEVRQIDIYELLSSVLGIEPAANDGEFSKISPVLKSQGNNGDEAE